MLSSVAQLRECKQFVEEQLPRTGPFHAEILHTLDLAIAAPPPVFKTVLPVEDAYVFPDDVDPERLALSDLIAASAAGETVDFNNLWPTTSGRSVDVDLATFTRATSKAKSSSIVNEKALPIVGDGPTTVNGLGRYPLRFPRAWAPLGDVAGSKGFPGHDTRVSFTYALAGTSNGLHQDYLGGHGLLAFLPKCYKVLFFWPTSPSNIAKVHEYFLFRQAIQACDAIERFELEGLRVLVVREPIALLVSPGQLHAFITLDNSVHVGGPIWTAAGMPTALRTAEHVFETMKQHLPRPSSPLCSDLDMEVVLLDWETSATHFKRFLKSLADKVDTEAEDERVGYLAEQMGRIAKLVKHLKAARK
jgi:hypothetical protein